MIGLTSELNSNTANPSDPNVRGPLLKKTNRCKTIQSKDFIYSKIDNDIHNLCGIRAGRSSIPNKNISWVITEEGVVVIDAGFPNTAAVAKTVIRSMTDKPIKYLIYTHHHGTQCLGAPVLIEPDTKIIAHEDLVIEFDLAKTFYQFNSRRDSIQFDIDIAPATPNLIYPNITYSSEYSFTCGGIRFELFHADAESQDYSIVYLPDRKVVWVADLLGGSMPLVGSPMKVVRDEIKWKKALERIKSLDPDILIQSVDPPFCDKKTILFKLNSSIEYLDFLHKAVAREMNKGSSVDESVRNISIPEHLKNNPFLKEYYGCLMFNVRGLYHKYSGWFDQNGTHLNPVSEKDKASSFITNMGGPESVYQIAVNLRQEGSYALALEYLDLLISDGRMADNAHREKAFILERMSNLFNYNPLMVNIYKNLAKMETRKLDKNRNTPLLQSQKTLLLPK